MKHKVLFSSKDKSKKIKMSSDAFLFGALWVKWCLTSNKQKLEMAEYGVNLCLPGFQVLNGSIQQNFSGLNTDGSFTTAVSNLCLSPLEKVPWL